jgi:hypothetical protein
MLVSADDGGVNDHVIEPAFLGVISLSGLVIGRSSISAKQLEKSVFPPESVHPW